MAIVANPSQETAMSKGSILSGIHGGVISVVIMAISPYNISNWQFWAALVVLAASSVICNAGD